jgi:GTP-binding protein
MNRQQIRNVAHVDHGKTTLVDQLLRQSGQFRHGELKGECILDSNPLEKERGITILAKNCAIHYTDRQGNDYHINIVDTPGHADFSGEVERVLRMADGVLLLVDAAEGVMPQTRYVLSKALAAGLEPIVVVNKVDRPDGRPSVIVDQVFDLLIELDAEHHAEEFPVLYASGRNGWAVDHEEGICADGQGDIHAVFDAIINHVPVPDLDPTAPTKMLITSLDYSEYVGRIGIGRVMAGTLRAGQTVATLGAEGDRVDQKVGQLLQFDGLGRREVSEISAGDLCAVVGLGRVEIGDTLADIADPEPLDAVRVDAPTLGMRFGVNNGPFAGKDGQYVTSRHLRDRLVRELQSNVALKVDFSRSNEGQFEVSGRGLMHLGILLENMRREGYELTVGKPRVIRRQIDGAWHEPVELLVVELPSDTMGSVMQLLGDRKADLAKMETRGQRTYLEFEIPARGLIGLRSRLLTATRGEAIVNHRFLKYAPTKGEIQGRINGVMIATETGAVTGYALDALSDRGVMFVSPGDQVYVGQIVGEHCKDGDIPVNVVKAKKLDNMRSANKEATVRLKTPRKLTLEAALEYIEADELVEITPNSVRLRKQLLDENDRKRHARRKATAAV